ncbi:hypothetical protein [Fluviispira vulneris]|uniref:hypothetical protein n=1 Tax=Fluviispira vulneris TaxID=2763012 RepID=UPI001645ED1C|nr:hypothetical protein [Fluviispira vulneris]
MQFPQGANKLSGFILIPPQNGIIKKFASLDLPEWVVEYNVTGKIGQNYTAAMKSTDNIASFVVEGATEKIVKQRLLDIEKWFNCGSEWIYDVF